MQRNVYKILSLVLLLVMITGCKSTNIANADSIENTSQGINNDIMNDYLAKINNTQDVAAKEYEIIEEDVFDLSTEGGHIKAIYVGRDLEFIQFTCANSMNTMKYEYSLFNDYILVSKTIVRFAPADTAKPFDADNFVLLDISQKTFLLSHGEILDLSGSDAVLSDELNNQEKEDLLNLFMKLLDYLDQ